MLAEKSFLINMVIGVYTKEVAARAPDRILICEEVRGVIGYDAARKFYVLDNRGWVNRERNVLVLRRAELFAECRATEIKPEVRDILLVAKSRAQHMRASQNSGGITLIDDSYYPEFPEHGVLLRKANGGHDVYMGEGVARLCSEMAYEIDNRLRGVA